MNGLIDRCEGHLPWMLGFIAWRWLAVWKCTSCKRGKKGAAASEQDNSLHTVGTAVVKRVVLVSGGFSTNWRYLDSLAATGGLRRWKRRQDRARFSLKATTEPEEKMRAAGYSMCWLRCADIVSAANQGCKRSRGSGIAWAIINEVINTALVASRHHSETYAPRLYFAGTKRRLKWSLVRRSFSFSSKS